MSYQSRQLMQQITKLQRDRDRLIQPEVSPDLISPFLALPMLRGSWAGAVDSTPLWLDQSGHDHHLTRNGNPLAGYAGTIPVWAFDGAGDYFTRIDEPDLSITGLEAYVIAVHRGLTWGGWFYFDNVPGADEYTINKSPDYYSRRLAAGQFFSAIFDNVGANNSVTSSVLIPTATWTFLVSRFRPGVSLCNWVNEVQTCNTTAIVADCRDGVTALAIGATGAGASPMTGRAALCFLCAAQLSDGIVSNLFQQTRGAFGV